jgi:hypothetical protein
MGEHPNSLGLKFGMHVVIYITHKIVYSRTSKFSAILVAVTINDHDRTAN